MVEDIDRISSAGQGHSCRQRGVRRIFPVRGSGTAAHDVAKLLDGIKRQHRFRQVTANEGKLSDRRRARRGIGSEGALLQSVFGSLEQSQSPEQFKENLKRLKTVYQDIIHGVGKWKEVAPAEPDATPTRGRGGWSIRPAP